MAGESASVVALRGIAVQRALPMGELLAVEVLVAAGLTIAPVLGMAGWCGAVVAAVLGLGVAVPVRGQPMLRRMLSWSTYRWGRRKRAGGGEPHYEPFDVAQEDGSQMGFSWDGRLLTSLVCIESDPHVITAMEPLGVVSGRTLPVEAVAECLRQPDMSVHSIDVIVRGARCHGRNRIAAVYDAVLGPLPAIAHRSVWVVVRLDPIVCTDAVARRGGDWSAMLQTAATATRRVVNRLNEERLRARIATASEFSDATGVLGRTNLRDLHENWSECRQGDQLTRSFYVKPAQLNTADLGELWKVPSQTTSICVSLRPNEREGDVIQVRSLVRFDTHVGARSMPPDLGRLPGEQYDALVSGLPLPRPRREVGGWAIGHGTMAIRDLSLPVSGCGQVVGADDRGRAVAVHLFGPEVSRVDLCGTLQLVQQVVLRSLALGARVTVHTERASLWRRMIDQVGDTRLLHIADCRQASEDPVPLFPVEVFDEVDESEVSAGVTAVVVKPAQVPPSAHADIALELLDADLNVVRVTTRRYSTVVTMVATDDETRYFDAAFELAR